MIYLFDRQKKLQKIIPKKHLLSATQTVKLNGLYQLSVEVPLFYETKEGTQYNHKKNIEKAWFAGHYDRQKRFQLYKIHARKISVKNDGTKVIIADGVHIFFDEAKAMGNIHDRRFRDTDVKAPADAAFNSIGWYIKDYDVTDRANITFYRDSVANARSSIIEKFGVEFDYGLTFDGRKIISKDLYIKKRLGRWTGKRFAYGSNLLSLSREEDESEVYTAAVGRGKGEEIGEGHGPRIEFGDIEWSKDGITKPVGQNWIEIPSATAEYGFYENGEIKPRIAAEVIFENTENKKLIADSTYYWLLENCVPKAVWKTDVAKSGIHDLGDSVGVIYKKADIVKIARVHKMENNLLDDALSKITLGDYQHFKTDKRQQSIRAQIKRNNADNQSVITQMKNDFDARFDAQVTAIDNAYRQALIDANSNIDAAEVRMQEEIDGQRTEIMQEVETSKQEAIQTAEENAEQKKQEVQSNLDSFKDTHQQLYDSVTADIIDIDEFLGDARDIPLDQRFLNMTEDFEQRLENSTRSASNLIRGSQFDEPDMYTSYFVGTSVESSEDVNFVRFDTTIGGLPVIRMEGELHLQEGIEYHLHLEYRTDTVTELDGFIFYHNDGMTERLENRGLFIDGLTTSGQWEHASMTLTPNAEMSGRLAIGTRRTYGTSPDGIIDVRLPYLTTTAHDQWLPHPRDENQNITEISRRITELEDGYSDFIVRSEWDAEMNEINQTIRDYQTTVDGVEDTIIQLENSELISRGREVLDTVDGFQRKVWLGDIDRPNLIPHADVFKTINRNQWVGRGSRFNGSFGGLTIIQADSLGNYIGMESPKIYDYVESGETYTMSWEGHHLSGYQLSDSFDYVYLVGMSGNNIRLYNIQRTAVSGYTNRYYYTATFEMPSTITENTRILFGVSRDGESGGLAYVRFGKPKLELGDIASPFETSFSMLEQRSDEISLAVQDFNNEDLLKQSDLTITADYWQLGSKRVDGDTVASVLRGTPGSIDAIVDEMNLTGNLNVKGQIESISMSAVNAEFADLFASQVQAGTVHADYVSGLTAEFEHMYTLNANIERLVSQHVFTNNVKTLSMDAVNANISSIRSNILTSDVILSDHINSSHALINKIFSHSAYIDTLTSKTAFIRDIQAIEVTLKQLNVDTIMDEAGKIRGGISIRRPDGAVAINNGMLKNEYIVNAYDPNFMTATSQGLDAFYQSGEWYVTSRRVRKDAGRLRFNAYQFIHSARYLEIEIGYRRHQTDVFFEIDSFGSYSFSQTYSQFKGGGGSTEYHLMKVDLGRPDYRRKSFYFYAYPDSNGDEEDQMWFRILRVVQTDF